MNVISGLKRFDSSEVATQRLKIIRFYDTHGEKITLDAFGVGRKTIYVWKKRLSVSKRKLTALIQSSTKPKCVRRIATDPKIISFIRNLREKYPRLGKEKIYPLLVAYCTKEGIKPIKESTIGKVIKRNSLFYQKQGKMYHNPNSKYATNRHKTKRQRVKYAPKPKNLGHIQMDTIARFEDGKKFYFYSFIDTKGKFAFCLPYEHLNSKNTVDFYKKVTKILPYNVKSVQSDNGLEFLGLFDLYLKQQNIPHLFTYPRCPRSMVWLKDSTDLFKKNLSPQIFTQFTIKNYSLPN